MIEEQYSDKFDRKQSKNAWYLSILITQHVNISKIKKTSYSLQSEVYEEKYERPSCYSHSLVYAWLVWAPFQLKVFVLWFSVKRKMRLQQNVELVHRIICCDRCEKITCINIFLTDKVALTSNLDIGNHWLCLQIKHNINGKLLILIQGI